MTLHRGEKTRFDGKRIGYSRGGSALWRLRYGRCSVDVWFQRGWIIDGHLVEGVGCVDVSGPALDAVQEAIAWDRDLRAESRRLG